MTDNQLEIFIGKLLRLGVLISALVVAAGGVLYLVQHHSDVVDYRTFAGEPADLRSVPGIWNSTLHLDSAAIVQLGILLLIATPIARVALAAVGFHLERDRLYTFVSLVVLGILLFSIMHAA